jgi:uncharacterized damage-inducible protein DinB
MYTEKQQFLDSYDREHATTMKVLRAFPPDKLDFRPHPTSNTAQQLAWTFVMERRLGTNLFHNMFANGLPAGAIPPSAPDSWDDLLAALEKAHAEFRELIRSAPDAKLSEKVRFFTGPKKMEDQPLIAWIWMLLSDQIHHRGQFSVYLRMVGGKVPSIYGPSGDEPWV